MAVLKTLLDQNKKWAKKIKDDDPNFFAKLSKQQNPQYLWIGCSDSRVPANQIVNLLPGEVFVHRNIANLVIHTDLNCLSVIQYAVEVLKVKHIIVCGHYECGGVKAALGQKRFGLIDNWLRNIKDIYRENQEEIDSLKTDSQKANRLCELNVKEQVANVTQTASVQGAWKSGQELSVHGWVYSIKDGVIKDLKVTISDIMEVPETYRMV